jgi:hypothetical protein
MGVGVCVSVSHITLIMQHRQLGGRSAARRRRATGTSHTRSLGTDHAATATTRQPTIGGRRCGACQARSAHSVMVCKQVATRGRHQRQQPTPTRQRSDASVTARCGRSTSTHTRAHALKRSNRMHCAVLQTCARGAASAATHVWRSTWKRQLPEHSDCVLCIPSSNRRLAAEPAYSACAVSSAPRECQHHCTTTGCVFTAAAC